MDGSIPFSMHPCACFPSICSALRPNPQSPESHSARLPYFLVPRFGQSFTAFLLDFFDQICGEFFFFFLIWKQIVAEGEKRCCLNSSSVSLVAQVVKNLPARQKTRFSPWVRKIPWRGHGNPLQYSCLENPHGQRSLVGYTVHGVAKESNTI